MYALREKIKHLRDLLAETHAEKDLALLVKKAPAHESIEIFTRSPKRYAEQILFDLLDIATTEEIRNHRRDPKNEDTSIENKELQDENEELKEKIADLEKKSTQKKSSKSTKSTPKSTGSSSKTKASK